MPDYKNNQRYNPIQEYFPDVYEQIIITEQLRAGKRLLYLKDGSIAIYDYADKVMKFYKPSSTEVWKKMIECGRNKEKEL